MLALFVVLGISCSKEDDEINPSVLPVTMEFVSDLSFPELSQGQEIEITFNRPAPVTGTVTIEVSPADATGFSTTPAAVDGEIQLQVVKGATGVSFTFEPQNDDELQGNRIINFILLEGDEHFLIGEKDIAEVTIFEDEVAASADFVGVNMELMENETAEVGLPVAFSVPMPGEATLKIKVEGENVGDFLTTVPAMDANNIIEISVPSGAWDATIKLKTKDNSNLDKHQIIKFKLLEVTGPVTLGVRQELALLIKDDELVGRLQSVETINGSSKILKTIEYGSNGRVSKVRSEVNASGNVLTQNYHYDSNGQLTSISGVVGDYDAFTWQNGKIVMFEKVLGFFGISQSHFEYQDGKLSRRRDFLLDNNRNAAETDRYVYTYHSNGNIKTELHTSLVNGVWQEVSSRTFDSHSQILNPSNTEATPFLFPQQFLPMTLMVNQNSITTHLYYMHIFDTAGKLTERKRNDNQESIRYSYY